MNLNPKLLAYFLQCKYTHWRIYQMKQITNHICSTSLKFIFIVLSIFSITEVSADSKPELNHVALIADGNRRWAKENNLEPTEGHKEGFIHTTPKLIEDLWDLGIHTVTVWGFSTANWNREEREVANLMEYFDQFLKKMVPIAKKWNAKIIHLGRKSRFPAYLQQTLSLAEKETSSCNGHVFNFAIDFGGRDEITRACQKVQSLKGNLDSITEEDLSAAMDSAQQPFPSPDLIIRASGEMRLSGFMPWNSIYSELYFIKKYYPSFTKLDLEEAIASFYERQRTYGK
ncbi:MAG: di-trans,poly-cis-decaprenylcistransferase [Verrucomicrobia bacterium]|nr:di-trans,poly-cis-decaprenylcistransferase [Verrucomicrobiota bacterium]